MPSVTLTTGAEQQVGTIYCIARNSVAHALELGNEPPDEPVVFLKSPSALRALDEGDVAFPHETYHHEAEVVLLVGERVALGADAGWSAVRALGLGLDLTRRGVQTALKEKRLPWTRAKSFTGSALVGPLLPLEEIAAPDELAFTLEVEGQLRQQGRLNEFTFDVPTLIAWLAEATELLPGDLIFCGTPPGVGELRKGQRFTLALPELNKRFFGRL